MSAPASLPAVLRDWRTRTDAFKRWFGQSKVVDAMGAPMVVYHGTASDVDAFDPRTFNKTYRRVSFEGRIGFFFTSCAQEAADVAEWAGRLNGSEDGAGQNVMAVYLSLQHPYIRKSGGEWTQLWFDRNWEDLQRKALRGGHDGIIVEGTGKAASTRMFVAFRPEQIKSALGNPGTFDPANPSLVDRPTRAANVDRAGEIASTRRAGVAAAAWRAL